MDYKGIKIYNKITIVEKTRTTEEAYNWRGRTVNQGYVVDQGNKKMLDTALHWAEWTYYDQSLINKYWEIRNKAGYDSKEAKEAEANYEATRKEMKGVVHEYDNGSFTITLSESADRSSQGGKLSFWNCIITAPDGNSFLVGINSELLLHLLMSTTFINGTCQEKIWLGRIGGNQVGVFTEAMEDFKQAKLDEEQRNAVKKANNKYIPGDIVGTLKEKQLYLGSVYKYYSFEQGYRYSDKYFVIYDKPKLVHIFRGFYKHWESGVEELNGYYTETLTKPKRLIIDHMDLNESAVEYLYKYMNDKIAAWEQECTKATSAYHSPRYCWDYAQQLKAYSDKPDTYSKEEIKEFLINKFNELFYCKDGGYRNFEQEYKFLTEDDYNKLFLKD
ncbi:MAG: hypothetical protein J6Z11_00500 [Candidatus Riflebacteria bacterium]|nr:hypothetical protein [Candidatus Riflebacteria bacterium]